jgi:hypothetical protein
MTVLELLGALQSSDNDTRNSAEQELASVIATDPSACAMELINTSLSHIEIASRQSALLYLKKIVPMYWSAGFESFQGPAISQEVKAVIRSSLLNLITRDRNSKIRNSGAYAVVQIAAVDYPDEWPDLLEALYSHMISLDPVAVLGGLSLLQDLMDDLVTEEQFFNGVGTAVISQCMKLMSNRSVDAEIKTAAAGLYKSCLLQLQNPDILDDPAKKPALVQHFNEIVTMLTVLLQDNTIDIHNMLFRTALYGIAYTLTTEFPNDIFERNAKLAIQKEAINDLNQLSPLFSKLVVSEDDEFPNNTDYSTTTVLNNIIIEQYQLLGSFEDLELFPVMDGEQFVHTMAATALLPLELESEYSHAYDLFVTEETGVSPEFNARNAIYDYLSEINPNDLPKTFELLLKLFEQAGEWRLTEAVLYMFDGLFHHESDFPIQKSVVELLNTFTSLMEHRSVFVRSRALILVPSFLSKFKSQIGGEFASKSLLHGLRLANNDESNLFKVAFLISLIYYHPLIKFEELSQDSQHVIFGIIASLIPSASEDTPPLLAEALTIALKINHVSIDALNLLFQIAAKDPGNIQLVIDIEEALEEILSDIDINTYVSYTQTILPSLLQAIEVSNAEFSSELALALQILNIFIYNSPGDLSPNIFNQIEPALSQLLLVTTDDQILQLGGDAFHSLVQHSEAQLFKTEAVLEILSKFLNPELSDSAALNVGSLVVSVVTKFSANLETILPDILKATTERLLKAKELATIEDLLSVLCYMISIDVNQTIQFLSNFEIQKIFNIWFSNFSSITGTEKIYKNCEALAKIYLSENSFTFTVDGDEIVDLKSDIIITRSKRKNAQFQQVTVPFKIIKLLIHELSDQCAHKEVDSNDLVDAVNDGDEEGWEDYEDIGEDFDKLRSYIENDGPRGSSDDLKDFLIGFFKKSAAKNVNSFKDIYNNLKDADRQILTACII